jgi:hypothetical protein
LKRFLLGLLLVTGFFLPAAAIDRDAFTTTHYQLEVHVDRNSHVMAVDGKLTLRNDSKSPQKVLALQVSSSLNWNAISIEDKPLQWLSDNYTSDIDHTGSLSEAIVNLPKEVSPGASITVAVQYGGTVTADATRLKRVGTPEDVAGRGEWDEISEPFTAVRGLGYVTWYPVAIEAVSLSDGNAVFDALAAWKHRHVNSAFDARILVTGGQAESLCVAVNSGTSSCGVGREVTEPDIGAKAKEFNNTLSLAGLEEMVPTFALANYVELDRPTITFLHIPEHTQLARDYAVAAEANDPLLHDWLGDVRQPARVIELTDPKATPWQNGSIVFTPLRSWPTDSLQLLLMPAQVAARFLSPHQWLEDGMERFLQCVSINSRSGRKAALDYLDQLREMLVKAEEATHPKGTDAATASAESSQADNTLLNSNDEVYLRGKSSFLLWMLRDMLGDTAMQSALARYRPGLDKDPSYFQRLLQTSSKRDLEWFFDDWVYRDRGLPDFHVASAYVRPLLSEATVKNYLLTVTVENRGHAGAEVPVFVQTPSGEKTIRILVKAGENESGRLELPIVPGKITVNDGSVPEANTQNNVYDVPPPSSR